jgi:hypothetical protein
MICYRGTNRQMLLFHILRVATKMVYFTILNGSIGIARLLLNR